MKFFKLMKDGGEESKVWGFFLAEVKSLFSVVLLRFADGSREAFHSHAFNSISWVLKGELIEEHLHGRFDFHLPSIWPVITRRDTFHKVSSLGNTYVFSLRGAWADKWQEFLPASGETVNLTHGRKVVK
jgi:hypothetical protein